MRRQFTSQAAVETILPALGRDVGREIGNTPCHHFGADVDDPAPALRFHVADGGLGEEHRALDEEVEHPLVEGPVVLFDGLLRLVAGGVQDHDVDRSQRGRDLGDHALDLGFVGDIRLEEGSLMAGCLKIREGFVGALGVVGVIEGHLGPGLSQGLGHAATETGGAARHEGDAAGEREGSGKRFRHGNARWMCRAMAMSV